MKLFGYLPETLFQPLAGPKKHVYARLLMRLYDRVFAARVLETPTRDDILQQIAAALPEAGVLSPDQLDEEGIERDRNFHTHYDPGGNGGPSLYTVDISGRNEQRVPTPGFASDPAWSPLLS